MVRRAHSSCAPNNIWSGSPDQRPLQPLSVRVNPPGKIRPKELHLDVGVAAERGPVMRDLSAGAQWRGPREGGGPSGHVVL
jgi:hypothetical protein